MLVTHLLTREFYYIKDMKKQDENAIYFQIENLTIAEKCRETYPFEQIAKELSMGESQYDVYLS